MDKEEDKFEDRSVGQEADNGWGNLLIYWWALDVEL